MSHRRSGACLRWVASIATTRIAGIGRNPTRVALQSCHEPTAGTKAFNPSGIDRGATSSPDTDGEERLVKRSVKAESAMRTDHPLISREELEAMSAGLIKSAARISETLSKLKDHNATEVISELSDADQQAFTCVAIVTERILDNVKLQFKGKRKPKKQAD